SGRIVLSLEGRRLVHGHDRSQDVDWRGRRRELHGLGRRTQPALAEVVADRLHPAGQIQSAEPIIADAAQERSAPRFVTIQERLGMILPYEVGSGRQVIEAIVPAVIGPRAAADGSLK